MFERKWEKQSESMKCQLAYGMCTPRRVTVSAAYIHRLEKRKVIFQKAASTREDVELLTTEIERLEGAKAEAEMELMYATSNRRRAEKRAAAAVAERDQLRAEVAELKAMVRAMRESMARPTVQEGQWRPVEERPAVQTATEAEPLRWVVADGTEKPSRWDFLEVDR